MAVAKSYFSGIVRTKAQAWRVQLTNWAYSTRRIQQIVRDYCDQSGLKRAVNHHLLRYQTLTYLTGQGISDAKIQLISGTGSRNSLEIYQHLSLESVEKEHQQALRAFDV